ncbi:uncharacterized protein LOC124452818 [Xenia sp. Carnegie-2017]|uniref:uncharacterized protein LOC124452818 n=1 Tax=Xenia sp. Carnegie-2017 TaxID=2897299 RepID=UPI001F042256|nr:uncharacterized protein LOC124452818 [Xenia sp. Carnegie-2017]
MSRPIVFVLGVDELLGQAAVKALSENFCDKVDVRAGAQSLDLVSQLNKLNGVTAEQVDITKHESLHKPLKGVKSVFIVTPDREDLADVIISAANVAKDVGVQHILVNSTPMAQLPNTIFGKMYSTVEKCIASLGIGYTLLRLPNLMEYNFLHKYSLNSQSTFSTAVQPDQWVHEISVDDAGLVAANLMVSSESYFGNTFIVVGDRHKFKDVALLFTEVFGREIKYVSITYEQATSLCLLAGMPKWKADGFIEVARCVNNGTLDCSDNFDGEFQKITGKEPQKFKTWLKTFAHQFNS